MKYSLLFWLFIYVKSFSNITNYANIDFLNITSNQTTILSNGIYSFIGVFDSNSQYKVLKYDLSTTPASVLGTYILNSTSSKRILIYQGYLIAYSNINNIIQTFNYTNFNKISSIPLNLSLHQLEQVKSMNIAIYLTANGVFGYLTNFLTSNNQTQILTNILLNGSFSISPNQQYVALMTSANKIVLVYKISGWTLVLNKTLAFASKTFKYQMCWVSDSSKLMVAPQNQGKVWVFNTSSGFSMTSFPFIGKDTFTISDMVYNDIQKNLIVAGYSKIMTTISVYSINLTSNKILISQNISLPFNFSQLNFDNVDNQFFAVRNQSSIKYYGLNQLRIENSSSANLTQNQSQIIANSSNLTVALNQTNSTVALNQSNQTVALNQANSTAALNQSNTTVALNQSNSTVTLNQSNSTVALNESNSTVTLNQSNSTIDLNQSNSAMTLSQTNSTIALNQSNSTIIEFNSFISQQQQVKFQAVLNQTLLNPFLLLGNKFPASRTLLKPFSGFFINFDDLWLYNYHNRSYDSIIKTIFDTVQYIQNEKWSQINYQQIWNFIGVNNTMVKEKLNYRYNYTLEKFIQIQGNSNGFFINTLDFFLSNFFLLLGFYLLCRLLFSCLFSYKISILFRNFSFCLYFWLMILQGNLQYFTYIFSFQVTHLFSCESIDKIIISMTLLIYFSIFLFAVSYIFISKYLYKGLSRYLSQNIRTNTKSGLFFIIGQAGLKNLIIGFVHFQLQQNYYAKLSLLLFVQIMFFIWTLKILSLKSIFQNYFKTWMICTYTLLRILLIVTFFLDYEDTTTIIQSAHLTIIYIMIFVMVMSFIIEIIRIFPIIIVFIRNNCENQNKSESNQDQNQIIGNKFKFKKKKKQKVKITLVAYTQLHKNKKQQISIDQKLNLVNIKFMKQAQNFGNFNFKSHNVNLDQQQQISAKDISKIKYKSRTIKIKRIPIFQNLRKNLTEYE